MAKAGDNDSTAWPPDGLALVEALPLVLPEAWAACLAAVRENVRVREAARRASRPFTIEDATPLMRAFERAEVAFVVGIHNLLKQGLFELWARPGSLFEEARQIPLVAIEALTRLDELEGKAWGPGMALVDLRLRQAARPPPRSSPAFALDAARQLFKDGKIYEGMTRADVARALEVAAKTAARAGLIRRAPKWSYMEDQLVAWGIWPLSLLLPKQK